MHGTRRFPHLSESRLRVLPSKFIMYTYGQHSKRRSSQVEFFGTPHSLWYWWNCCIEMQRMQLHPVTRAMEYNHTDQLRCHDSPVFFLSCRAKLFWHRCKSERSAKYFIHFFGCLYIYNSSFVINSQRPMRSLTYLFAMISLFYHIVLIDNHATIKRKQLAIDQFHSLIYSPSFRLFWLTQFDETIGTEFIRGWKWLMRSFTVSDKQLKLFT